MLNCLSYLWNPAYPEAAAPCMCDRTYQESAVPFVFSAKKTRKRPQTVRVHRSPRSKIPIASSSKPPFSPQAFMVRNLARNAKSVKCLTDSGRTLPVSCRYYIDRPSKTERYSISSSSMTYRPPSFERMCLLSSSFIVPATVTREVPTTLASS